MRPLGKWSRYAAVKLVQAYHPQQIGQAIAQAKLVDALYF